MTYYCGTFQFMFVSFNAVAVSKGRRHIWQTQNNYRASVILELTLLKISSGLNRHVWI